MRLFVHTDRRFNDVEKAALEARLPGLRFWGHRLQVPDNAAPELEGILARNRITYRIQHPGFSLGSPYLLAPELTKPAALLPYQQRVLEEGQYKDSVLLKSGTGSGKTLMGLALALQRPGPIVWLTLSVAKQGHLRQWQTWSRVRAQVIDGQGPFEPEPDARVFILNWEILSHQVDRLLELNPTTIVFDELPKAKQAKRARRVPTADGITLEFEALTNISASAAKLTKARSVKRRIGMSATFLSDRVRDLWSQLDLVYPYDWGTRAAFAQRYCDRQPGAFGGLDDRGASNLDELKRRVDRVITRVSKAESHSQLPALRREIVRLSADDLIPLTERQAARKVAGAGLTEAQLALSSVRKRKVVRELALEALNDGQKVVVGVGRRKEAQELTEYLRKAVKDDCVVTGIWGELDGKARDEEAQRYINAPGAALLVTTIQSMGRAFDGLQCTNLVLVSYLPYTPEEVVQFEGRFARLGQGVPCLIKYLVAMGGLDERIVDFLLDKLDAFQAIFDEQSVAAVRQVLGSGKSEAEIEADLLTNILKHRHSELRNVD